MQEFQDPEKQGEPRFCQPILPQHSDVHIEHLGIVLLSHVKHIIYLAIYIIKTTVSLY